MKIILIRHFQTPGNLLGRYIGVTDEDIIPCDKGNLSNFYPVVNRIYVSPMRRCIQTAEYIYPNSPLHIKEGFRECDFGQFENKNYHELNDNPNYQEWINSMGKMRFPEGEDPEAFKQRCQETFCECVMECRKEGVTSVAMIVHGGTIMSIMEAFDEEEKSYYDYQVKNGNGYVVEFAEEELRSANRKFHCLSKLVKEC